MVEKKYSRKEPDLKASHTVIREFYAKEEFFVRFFKRLTDTLTKHYGQEKAAKILKAIGDSKTKILGLEEFYNAKVPMDLGTRAYNKVRGNNTSSTIITRYIEACKELKEEVLIKGYKGIDITSVLVNVTKLECEDVKEYMRAGAELAELFCTYSSNPFTFKFYGAALLPRMGIIKSRYSQVMTDFMNTLMHKKSDMEIPYGYRVQCIQNDRRKAALAYIKDEFRNYSIKTEINEIFGNIEEFSTDSEEELRAFEKLSELLGRPYIFAHWMKDKVAEVINTTTLSRFVGVHERTSHFNKNYPRVPYRTLVTITQEDIYLACESLKEGDIYYPHMNIEFNCNGLNLETIEATVDSLILLSISRERLSPADPPKNTVHRVVLTGCSIFNQEFVEAINLRARKLASKYNKDVELLIHFNPAVAESKSGLGTPEYLRVISDMHVDINMERDYTFDFKDDFIVNAGDTSGNYGTTADWVRTHIARGVVVAGNHLGYDSKYGANGVPAYIEDTFTKIQESRAAQKENLEASFTRKGSISLLEDRFVERYGIFFWGSELRSDFKIFGEENQAACMMEAARGMNDFRRCVKLTQDKSKPKGEQGVVRTYTPEDHLAEFGVHTTLLNKHLHVMESKGPDTPVVLVTHFVPSVYGVAEEYRSDPITAAFASDLTWVLEKFPNVRLWCFGHTHRPFDFIYKQCRFVCNPFGYFNENGVNTEEYGTRIKLSDIRSDKPWTNILSDEIASGIIKVYK